LFFQMPPLAPPTPPFGSFFGFKSRALAGAFLLLADAAVFLLLVFISVVLAILSCQPFPRKLNAARTSDFEQACREQRRARCA